MVYCFQLFIYIKISSKLQVPEYENIAGTCLCQKFHLSLWVQKKQKCETDIMAAKVLFVIGVIGKHWLK